MPVSRPRSPRAQHRRRRVPPALILGRFKVGEQVARLTVSDHQGCGGSADHRRLLRCRRSPERGRTIFQWARPRRARIRSGRVAQRGPARRRAVADQVRGLSAHLREGEDVRHARADARVEPGVRVHLTVGAGRRNRPAPSTGKQSDRRVKISDQSAAQVFVVPGAFMTAPCRYVPSRYHLTRRCGRRQALSAVERAIARGLPPALGSGRPAADRLGCEARGLLRRRR